MKKNEPKGSFELKSEKTFNIKGEDITEFDEIIQTSKENILIHIKFENYLYDFLKLKMQKDLLGIMKIILKRRIYLKIRLNFVMQIFKEL